ncbi:hypothetical protein VU07_00985 [Desulfobulbus sp. F4]|nr:hypothetical protein [Desulfobulbus sp. F4]
MKRQRVAILTAAVLLTAGAGGGFVRSAYSSKLLLTLPPILTKKHPPAPRTILNDTGITWSGNYVDGNNAECVSDGENVVAAQD